MENQKRHSRKLLSILLVLCMVLSIVPVTAFASEDTDPTKSENAVGEETQLTEQQNATEETSNSVIENTSEDTNTENKDEQIDKSNEKSSAEVATLALEQPKPDYLPQGVTYFSDGYKHAYHTRVDVTANVSVKDSNGAVVETKQVTKSSEEFLEGGVGTLQAKLAALQAEIETPYQASGTVTRGDGNGQMEFDHFESAHLYTFTPTSGDPVKFSTDLDAAKQYFREHPDATGTFHEFLDVHEYQKYNYTYDLNVQEPDAVDEAITMVDIGNIWKNLDASQPIAFTAEVNPNSECANQMTLTDEFWMQWTIDGPIIAKSNPKKPVAGATYRYGVKLTAKDGYYFHDGFKGSGVGCTVICDGSTITAFSGTLSDDRKQLILWFDDIKVTATDESSQNSIGDVDIEGVTFNYEPGDVPKATAYKCDPWDEQYDIEYEYWEEMETNVNGESIPVKYWYSDESKNNALAQDKKITTFEDGKTYMYSLSLKARDGNTFAANSKVMVNGTNVNNANITNTGTGLFVVAVRTIKPETVQLQNISIVEINNATISFKVGDKPVFTGKTAENVPYIYQSEFWSTDGGKKYHYSADFWNDNNPDDLFTEFESGKTYTYGIYFKAKEGYCFTTDTKLKINGKYYDYDITDYDPLLQYPNGGYATMWVDTNLTITPTTSSHTHSYGTDWKSDADNHWHECSCGSIADKAAHDMETKNAKDATATEKGYTGDKVCKVCGYTVKGKEIPASGTTKPTNPTKPDGNTNVTSPKTGDNSNLALWFAVLFISCGGVIGVTVYSRRRKLNKR